MTSEFVILGSGDGSKEVADLINSNYKKNFSIRFIKKKQKINYSKNYLFLISMGLPQIREKIFNTLKKNKIKFIKLIHKSVYLSKFSKVGLGTIIYANSTIGSGVKIGKNCIIGANVSIGHDVIVGDHSVISPGSCIGGGSKIGKNFFCGLNTTIIPYITVGKECNVSAGAILKKDLKPKTKFIDGRSIRLF